MLIISGKDLLNLIAEKIRVYDQRERISMASWYLEARHSLSRTDILSGKETQYDPETIEEFCRRVNSFEPIQYILGETEFFGLKFKVGPGVLIPRPETEELVDWILQEHQQSTGLSVLDVGTGSGCIPVALAKNLQHPKISAYDISDDALRIGEKNASENNCKINFQKFDIISDTGNDELFDIIVSNPPYIELSEKEMMKDNVLRFEPELALFTPENEPLFFYRSILGYAVKHLKKGGRLYFEINERFGQETAKLMKDYNFKNITLRQDLNGKDRMLMGCR